MANLGARRNDQHATRKLRRTALLRMRGEGGEPGKPGAEAAPGRLARAQARARVPGYALTMSRGGRSTLTTALVQSRPSLAK